MTNSQKLSTGIILVALVGGLIWTFTKNKTEVYDAPEDRSYISDSRDEPERTPYCSDSDGNVVPAYLCDKG